MKHFGRCLIAVVVAAMAGCAQVPKESVELSSTVGRDVTSIQASHVALIKLYFDDKEALVNRWVDQVYTPSQITAVVGDPDIRAELEKVVKEAAAGKNQETLIKRFGSVLTRIRNDVEKTRKELLAPLQAAREDTLAKVQTAYSQVQLGNSIVTGYLASLVKITDTQNELLAKAGLEDVRDKLSNGLVALSDGLDKALATTQDKCNALAGLVKVLSGFTKKVPVPPADPCK